MIRVEQFGGETLERSTKTLQTVPGGIEKAVKAAMLRASIHLRSESSKKIREKYAINASEIRIDKHVKPRLEKVEGGYTAIITFGGAKIPLYRYNGASPKQDTRQDKVISTWLNGGVKKVHPSIESRGKQFKGHSAKKIRNAFVVTMNNGHTGIFERTGKPADSDPLREKIQEVMGSSVPQMLGNEDVQKSLAEDTDKFFQDRLEHEVTRILLGL